MARFDRFLIAPIQTGLDTSMKPWLIPDDAYAELKNAYVFRGRLRKRFGSRFMGEGWSTTQPESIQQESLYSRLRINVGTTDGSGDFALQVIPPGVLAAQAPGAIGQQFSIGTTIFTVVVANGGLLTTGAATGTFNTTTRQLSITGNAENITTIIYWYPALPVMGLTNYGEGSINNKPSYAFDTRFAYVFQGGSWQRSGTGTIPIWHGTNLNFFWAANWQGITPKPIIMFVTNFYTVRPNGAGDANDDPIWYFNGTIWTPAIGATGFFFRPNRGAPRSGPYVKTARIIVPFKNRLVLLNTVENDGTTATTIGTTLGTLGGAPVNFSVTTTIGLAIGTYFVVNETQFTIISAAAGVQPLQVSGAGLGTSTGTYNTTTGDLVLNLVSPVSVVSLVIPVDGINTNFINRARWCHYGSPFSNNAWYEQNQIDNSNPKSFGDGGGYNDAATDEAIISAEFIKDRLIVYFERSTWELVYTGNQVTPFAWQKINTELGSESTFSTVPFDREVLTIGNQGIHSCNGSNVQRIDNKIPNEVFEISNKQEGVHRVCGIRDYFVEMVYWTFPSNSNKPTDSYTDRILVYNYKNGSWSFNDDCINTFGYYEQQTGTTWASTSLKWLESGFAWDSATKAAQFRQVIAGNQQGYTFIIDAGKETNAAAMQITNLTVLNPDQISIVLIDHVLSFDDYISIENISIVGNPLPINASSYYRVSEIINKDTVVVSGPSGFITGAYRGGGNSARVSRIDIRSKQWNPYVDKDRNASLSKIDFAVTRTKNGEITVDYAPSAANISMLELSGPTGTAARMGTGILETRPYDLAPIEAQQERLWHPVYFQIDGTCVQTRIYLSNAQMANILIADSPFEIQGLILYFMPTTNRMQ